ncbi:zincin-like metallopeptidase domain-containing protein [Acerihabitans sp. TG2]|uniref:ArdC family protein n=1 Tax=Acerihabitans sp. TG2 TaxID=3096008 RepID=UPI002B221D83|nr:zincin-like metallopeptidase domain-containing protein [Acerihabitans sp. TG2]MEA9392177.1 zincin-like metallopeptidase domain-containing protein [Acerihabitans sp. TG2]
MAGNKKDIRKELTDRVIEILENGETPPWRQKWDNVMVRPFNPYSGTRFKGGNVLNLLLEQSIKSSIDPRWMTFGQIKKSGLRLNKGSSAAYVEYWSFYNKNKEKTQGLDEPQNKSSDADDEDEKIMFSRFYAEFNGADIEGLPELYYERPDFEPHEMIERLIAASGVSYQHRTVTALAEDFKTDAAFYNHVNDMLVMPPKGAFESADAYYATFLHELCHWTGHADRLRRREPGETRSHDSVEYATEELRAEIGSCILTSMFGLKADVESHAAYTTHYLNLMRAENGGKHVLFKAAKDAEAIIDYLFEFDPELREILEGNIIEANNLHNGQVKEQIQSDGVKPIDIPDFTTQPEPLSLVEISAAVLTSVDAWQRFCEISHSKCMDANLSDKYVTQIKEREKDMFEAHLKTLDNITEKEVDSYASKVVQGWERASEIHGYWGDFCKQMRTLWDADESIIGDGAGEGREAFLHGVLAYRKDFAQVAEVVKRSTDLSHHQDVIGKLMRSAFMSEGEPVVSIDSYRCAVMGHVPPQLLTEWQKRHYPAEEKPEVTEMPPSVPSGNRYDLDDENDDVPYVKEPESDIDELNGALPVFDEPPASPVQGRSQNQEVDEEVLRPLGNALDLTVDSSPSI